MITVIAMGILFLGGVNGRMFFLITAVLLGAFVLMITLSDWRRERIFAYLDPWDEKYTLGKAYQLSHSLIAFGRGEIFGQGLGSSVEKLHYLPEAHTDFLLAVIGEEVAPGAHAVILVDQAGWHTTPKLDVPDNITLMPLPPRSPELNPVENIWQYMRANWLSNRVFETYDAIIEAACEAWNKLIALPDTIKSIGMRDWAHVGRGK